MNEITFVETLRLLLYDEWHDDETGIRRIETYAEAGILTNNAGLVVELADGSQFQVTVVGSKP